MPKKIQASRMASKVPSHFYLRGDKGSVNIQAAQGEGEAKKLRRFDMLAYTGGPMDLAYWAFPTVVDLDGLDVSAQLRPILRDHLTDQVVGHSDKIQIKDYALAVTGVISGVGVTAQEVVGASDNGFPWRASVGASALSVLEIKDGEKATANGREFDGPCYIVRKSRLDEVSFVALGADDATTAKVAAGHSAEGNTLEAITMSFEQWLEKNGIDPATLDEANKAALQKMYDAEQKEAEEAEAKKAADADAKPDADAKADEDKTAAEAAAKAPDIQATVDLALKAERARVSGIQEVCAREFPEIEAKAIKEDTSVDDTRAKVLKAMREKRPSGDFHINAGATGAEGQRVIEAALALSGKLPKVEKAFTERELEAAHRQHRGLGLQEVLLQAAREAGFAGRNMRADMRGMLQAAFSNANISGILSNTANKFLLAGFDAIEKAWREITFIRNASDFKTMTSYRLTGTTQYEKVAPTGELKHGTLGEESYTNKVDTYGLILAITRQDLINDDLGALTAVPQRIGRGAGLKLNDVFWTAFLDNSTFFTAARGNYAEGAGTALGVDSLTAAELLFGDQTDADGKPAGVIPEILLVPNALKVAGTRLEKSLELRDTTASKKYVTQNPHAGKFRTVSSAYLGNSSYGGYSILAWYLAANPATYPAMEVAFLNGQESPTVETAEADFSVLGIQMRGYHDFGCSKAEYRAGVKMKGEA